MDNKVKNYYAIGDVIWMDKKVCEREIWNGIQNQKLTCLSRVNMKRCDLKIFQSLERIQNEEMTKDPEWRNDKGCVPSKIDSLYIGFLKYRVWEINQGEEVIFVCMNSCNWTHIVMINRPWWGNEIVRSIMNNCSEGLPSLGKLCPLQSCRLVFYRF